MALNRNDWDTDPLISVIIPVYNVMPYLREALDSVVEQTYKNLEIIIVDDNSTDGSGSICDEYLSDSRVQVIHLQENRGLSCARNMGLDRMTGEYISFLDSDDAFHPDMIRDMLEVLIQQEADLVACSFGIYETEGCLVEAQLKKRIAFEKEKTYTSREVMIGQMEDTFDEVAWNKLYKRFVWGHLRFPDGRVYEDMRVMPLIYEQCKRIATTPKMLVYHRLRSGSITRTHSEKNMRDLLETYTVLQDYTNQVQPPFPSESIHAMNEGILHTLMLHWAEMRTQGASENSVRDIWNEIKTIVGEKPEFWRIENKVLWKMFRYCPRAIAPVRTCVRCIKQICEKTERK